MESRPKIVTLCGSTRFSQAFQEANLRETLAGNIVLTIGCDMRSDADLFEALTPPELADVKHRLDELHKRKIDVSDEVLILNVGGYIGESTRSELRYAQAHGKAVRWLEPVNETPETTERQQCGSCGAEIVWLKNDKTGKPAPINAEWSADGNIAILPNGTYKVYSAKMLATARPRTPLHTNHFMTCPQSKVWTKRGGRH